MYLEDLAAAARAVRRRLTTSRTLVEACLRRYDEREPVLHAFTWLDRDRALRLADAADAASSDGRARGTLHGVPLGVKDIFDTAGIPTENGSALFAGRVPDRNAAVVDALERAGAIVIGKTVTTELAFYHPGATTNPHDPSRTPGGSSMGSAAAVAAGILPAAVGSQTNGSTIRPASFCGVVGAKPTHGRISLAGVMPFAPTLDTAGAFARTVEGAAWSCAAMSGEELDAWWSGAPSSPPRFAAARTKDWERADEPMRARFQQALDALAAAGRPIEWPTPPEEVDEAVPTLATIMRYEGARSLLADVKRDPDVVSRVARTFFEEGERIPAAEYDRAIDARSRIVDAFRAWAEPYDAILALAAIGEAPGPESTGDPIFCTRWTLIGAPAVTIPMGRGPSGLPLGLQLVAVPGKDRELFAAAAWAEKVVSGW